MKTNGLLHSRSGPPSDGGRYTALNSPPRASLSGLRGMVGAAVRPGVLLLLFVVAGTILLSAPNLGAASYDISITADGFYPSYLEVHAGDTVTWWNDDYDFYDYHSTRSYSYPWSSGPIPVGYGVYLTVTRLGTFDYTDDWGFAGWGTLVVSPAGPPPPPPNDTCSGAIPLTDSVWYTMDTSGATSTGDPTPSCASFGKGVWFTYTALSNGLVTVSTCGSSFDTVVAVYTGTCGALTSVACNDDDGAACSGSAASVVFAATPGSTYNILAGGYGGSGGTLAIIASNAPTAIAWQEAQVSYDIGSSLAQPNANLVYFVDNTNDRLLTFNTDTGAFVSSSRLEGKLGYPGLMCLSLDGQTLYVPLANTNKLQVISLATMATADLVPLTVSPTSIAAGSDGALYATVNDGITKLDPLSGEVLGSVAHSFYEPLLKANTTGSRLYLMEMGLSGGIAKVDEYLVVPSALPTYVTNHYWGHDNDKDLVIAEDIGWLYTASGGIYGVGAWNMNTRTYSFWPFSSPYGVAVAMVPNDNLVYGASGDPYAPQIYAFDRLTGAVSNIFNINAAGRGSGAVSDRSLKVTPNGRVFYARSGRKLGLIGSPTLLTNTPPVAEIVDGGTNRTVVTAEVFTLNAGAPGASGADSFTWTKLAGPAGVNFSSPNSLTTTAQISAAGNYTLQIERTNSAGWFSRDRVYVTVNSRPIVLDQPVVTGGGFQMRLTGDPGNFQVLVSTNLVNWTVLTNVANPTGQITLTVPATSFARSFYKAKLN